LVLTTTPLGIFCWGVKILMGVYIPLQEGLDNSLPYGQILTRACTRSMRPRGTFNFLPAKFDIPCHRYHHCSKFGKYGNKQ